MPILSRYIAVVALVIGLAGCAPDESVDAGGAPDIVVGSAHVRAIVRDLSGGAMNPHNLIPPAACPGHCDMRPSDVDAVAGCGALLIHPWQQNMANVQGVINAAGIGQDRVRVVDVPGNWMAPSVQAAAVEAVAAILRDVASQAAAIDPERVSVRAEAIAARGEVLALELKQAGDGSVPVLCSEIQSGFVKWAGFGIASTFARAEDLSVADVEALIRIAEEKKVALVIDNLQSGEVKTSEAVAREVGAVHVVLSNFPGGFDDTETWDKAVRKNVDLLLEATAKAKQRRG